MKRVLMGLMLLSSLFLSNVSYAGYAEGTPFSSGNTNTTPAPDAYGMVVRPIGGAPVQTLILASGVTTNTTTTVGVPGVVGYKTFWMEVRGTGAVTATVTIYGARVANATAYEMVALTTPTALSGTTVAVNAAATSTAPYPYYYVKTENVTGTGATVLVEVFY